MNNQEILVNSYINKKLLQPAVLSLNYSTDELIELRNFTDATIFNVKGVMKDGAFYLLDMTQPQAQYFLSQLETNLVLIDKAILDSMNAVSIRHQTIDCQELAFEVFDN